MPRIIEVAIVSSDELSEMEIRIIGYINIGFQPLGGISTVHNPIWENVQYTQLMVKYAEPVEQLQVSKEWIDE